ncbi:MAG TPA: hypothetical protein VNT79_02920, partial [Phycisphaerae bacterium]|nr:hypothetical protein [Phycisphaerae bacterium]
MNTRLSAAIIILLMLVPASSPGETPLGTAFTYQGQLKDAGSPVDGNYNMVFQLFDAPTLGNQIGPTLTFNGAGGNPPPVSIMDGLFTVALDFSSAAFGGSKRWLSITVGGTALTPRQELTAAPNAINADKLDGLNSTAFLQSIPAPLTLSGTSSTHIIRGENASTGFLPMAIYGLCSGTSGGSTGVRGESASTNGRGVIGFATAVTGTTYGGQFESTSTSGTGVWGMASASTGATTGGKFENDSTAGTGVLGLATAGSGTNYAVYGSVSSATGYAGYFLGGRNHFAGNVGIGTTAPEEKLHVTGGTDTSPIGGGFLVLGHTNGAHLSFDSNEIMARDDEGASDLFINHEGGNVLINAGSGAGRVGIGTTTPLEELHVIGNAEITEELFVGGGVHASSLGANSMAIQLGATFNSGPSVGFAMQVFTDHPDDIGIRAYGPTNPSPVGHAAQFLGNVDVIGEVSKDGGSFKIDHPLDPANKYLKHSFVESPDMM